MNQTGSGFGAGFFYAEKGTEHKKAPGFTGKSGRKYRAGKKENLLFYLYPVLKTG